MSRLSIFPNPTTVGTGWTLRVDGPLTPQHWTLRDAVGRVVRTGRWPNPETVHLSIAADGLAEGQYTLHLAESAQVIRLVKQ